MKTNLFLFLLILNISLVAAIPQTGIGISPGCLPNDGPLCLSQEINSTQELVTYSFRVYNWDPHPSVFSITLEGIEAKYATMSHTNFELGGYSRANSCEGNPGCQEVSVTVNTTAMGAGNYSGYITATNTASTEGMIAVKQAVKGRFSFQKLPPPPTIIDYLIQFSPYLLATLLIIGISLMLIYLNDKKKAFIVSKVVTSLDKKHTRVRIHISNESKYQKQPVAFFLIADTVPHKVTEIRLIKDKKESKLKTLKVEEKTLEKDVKKALESKRSSVLLIEDRLVFLLKSNKAPLALKQSDFIELSYDYKKSAIHELEIVETHIFEGSESEEFEPQEFTKEFISNLILKEEVEKQEETQETKEPNKSKEHKQDE